MHPAHWYVPTVSWKSSSSRVAQSSRTGMSALWRHRYLASTRPQQPETPESINFPETVQFRHRNMSLAAGKHAIGSGCGIGKLTGRLLPRPRPLCLSQWTDSGVKGCSTSLPVTLLGHLCKQGFRGFKGEKGEPGQPGLDGLDAPCQLVQYFSFSSSSYPCMPLTLSHHWSKTMHDLRARQAWIHRISITCTSTIHVWKKNTHTAIISLTLSPQAACFRLPTLQVRYTKSTYDDGYKRYFKSIPLTESFHSLD